MLNRLLQVCARAAVAPPAAKPRQQEELKNASLQAVRVALPELRPPPFGFGKHSVTVWRKFDVSPTRAWEVRALARLASVMRQIKTATRAAQAAVLPPDLSWQVLSDWRAPYISASGTGALC
jgi:hypothetical protein